ncbi:MAG: helix-turn-helix transcriptional regulator [Oscillospiraceae bacterium]|nr:helix-turn-helix transcriptional regulator [Oscillospiraceae bacterium]
MVNILSERIAELRRARGLTQEQLGQTLGVSAQAVSKWEKGGAPDVELLPTLADQLGVSVDALFGREGGTVQDMDNVLNRWLLSLSQEKRISELCRLTWSASRIIMNHRIDAPDIPELKYSDNCTVRVGGEDVLLRVAVDIKEGLLFGVGSEELSFMSIWPRPEAGYAAYFADRDLCRRLFALLARPGCLELLERLHNDLTARYYVPEVLAKQLNQPPEQTAELLASMEELTLVKKLELEMEAGSVNAYIVHENWALTPFLLFTRCLLEKHDAFYLLWDDHDNELELSRGPSPTTCGRLSHVLPPPSTDSSRAPTPPHTHSCKGEPK